MVVLSGTTRAPFAPAGISFAPRRRPSCLRGGPGPPGELASEREERAMANQVYLFRHGETEWSKSLRHTGRTDLPLTEEGRRRAVELGKRVRGHAFALVLTSPLSRAVETCRLAAPEGPVEVSEDLQEWDYGEYEGRTTTEIRQ